MNQHRQITCELFLINYRDVVYGLRTRHYLIFAKDWEHAIAQTQKHHPPAPNEEVTAEGLTRTLAELTALAIGVPLEVTA